MPRPRNIEARAETAAEIKAIARQQLADKGTSGISLRGIARELGMTAPAIYNYFPKLDDLITALLVDAFTGHADAIDAAIAENDNPVAAFRAGLQAYRHWAIEHPADFQLIYGNPIPGYEAPRDVTVPLASRPQESFFRCILAAYQAGQMQIPPEYETVPEQIAEHVAGFLYQRAPEIQGIPHHMAFFYMMEIIWTRIHGIVMLEIHEHLGPTIGDVETFYNNEIDAFFKQLSMKP